jgi:hypothetical protein
MGKLRRYETILVDGYRKEVVFYGPPEWEWRAMTADFGNQCWYGTGYLKAWGI